ncbi:hypothetical protein [Streptomyces sp. NPDC001139]
MTDDDGIPVVMHHTTCGHDTHTKVVCSSCDEIDGGHPRSPLGCRDVRSSVDCAR